MNSVVLWYDVGRQGATNELMAENPTLKDLSGNGNDATCYNFGWSGMSGIGGYPFRMNSSYIYLYRTVGAVRAETTVHIPSITAQTPELINNNYIFYWFPFDANPLTGEYITEAFTLKINNPNHLELKYRWIGAKTSTSFNSSITISVPSRDWNVNNKQIAFGIFQADASADVEDANLTIEVLPQYPNALVSDGVDDYAAVSGLPIQNWNVGYTVIAKRKTLDTIKNQCLFSKRLSGVGVGDASGAFQVERIDEGSTSTYPNACFSYGRRTGFEQFEPSDFIYQTSKSYCGHPLTVSSAPDSDTLSIFKWTAQSSGVPSGKYVLYSLILFNRDLTDEEIQWVKNNLMQ